MVAYFPDSHIISPCRIGEIVHITTLPLCEIGYQKNYPALFTKTNFKNIT